MHCNLYPMSTFLCKCDCDYTSMYSTSWGIKSSNSHCEPPHEFSCCCNYNPFTDETKDNEIHDLDFALRKLAVMKCQMKKWRIERLQLESDTRSLKKRLQELGVKSNEPLIEDPLMIHYRDENVRLENMKKQLEGNIRDLKETISEHELYRNPCKGINKIREKMHALHEKSRHEKKKYEETLFQLEIKLTETGGGSPCAGVNRLRARLRELLEERRKETIISKKQQSATVVEKSIETLKVMSKSCDDLRVENERIHAENLDLRRKLRSTVDTADVEYDDIVEIHPETIGEFQNDGITIVKEKERNEPHDHLISESKNHDDLTMRNKLIECNDLIEDLKRKIDDKDKIILDLKKKMTDDIEKIQTNHTTLNSEVVDDNKELKRCEEKVKELLNQLTQSSLDFNELNNLKSQIQIVQTQFNDMKIERDNLLDKMNKANDILYNKDNGNDELNDKQNKILPDLMETNTTLQGKIDTLPSQEVLVQKEIEKLKDPEIIQSLIKENIELMPNLENLQSELSINRDKIDSEIESVTSDLIVSKEKAKILNSVNAIDSDQDYNFQNVNEIEIKNCKDELNKCKHENKKLDEMLVILRSEKSNYESEIKNLKLNISQSENSNEKLQYKIDELNNTIENITNKSSIHDKSKDDVSELSTMKKELHDKSKDNVSELSTMKKELHDKSKDDVSELSTMKKELHQLVINLDNVKSDNVNLKTERDMLKNELIELQKELTDTIADNIEKSKSQLSYLQSDNKILKEKIFNLEQNLEQDQLQINKLKEQLKNKEEELRLNIEHMNEFDAELAHMKNKNHELEIIHGVTTKKISTTSNQINDLSTELNALKNELMHCRNENEKLQNDLNNSKRDSIKLNNEMENIKNNVLVSKNHNEKMQSDNEFINNELDVTRNNLNISKLENDTLKVDNATLKNENDNLQTENSYMKNNLTNLKDINTNLTSKLESLQSEILKCRTQNDQLSLELKRLKDEYGDNKNEYNTSINELETLRKSLSSNEHQVHIFESNVEALEAEKRSLLMALNGVRAEVDELKRVMIVKDTELEKMEAMREELIALKNELNKCREKFEYSNHELDLSKKKIDMLQNENNLTKEQLIIANKQIDDAKDLKNIENERDLLKKQLDDLKMNFVKLKEIESTRDALLEELNALKDTLGELRKDLERCNMESVQLQHELDKWQNDTKKLLTELDEIKKENVKLVSEITVVNDRYSYLNRELDDVKSKNSELIQDLTKMRGKTEDITAECNKLKTDNVKMKTDKDELVREQDEMRNELKNFMDDNNKCQEEMNNLKTQNEEILNELESAKRDLKLLSQYDGQITTGENEESDEMLTEGTDHMDLIKSIQEIKNLRRENDELLMDLEKLKIHIDEIKTENETERTNFDDSSILKKTQNETEKRKDIAEEFKKENSILTNNLSLGLKELKKPKHDTEKIIEENDSLQSEILLEHTQFEDVKYWQSEVERLNVEIERLKKENEILKNNEEDEPMSVKQLLVESDRLEKNAEDLKKENMQSKNDFEEIHMHREQSKQDIGMKGPLRISKKQSNAGELENDTLNISNELIKTLDILRMKMEKQLKGVIRIRENIGNMKIQIWSESPNYTDSEDTIVIDTTNPIIAEVLELSNDLSVNIFSAEDELINFTKKWRSRWEENATLKNLVEDSGDVATTKTVKLLEDKVVRESSGFDPESWLNSLTLTQLADLHDKICFLTLNLVRQDSPPTVCNKSDDILSSSCNQGRLQRCYDVHNKKIAALQRKIAEKQTDAGHKVAKMHQILRREQAELIRISDAMNEERKRNLILHLTIDEPLCRLNDCTAECAKNIKFTTNISRRK